MGYIRSFSLILVVLSFNMAASPTLAAKFQPYDIEYVNLYGINPRLLKAILFVESSLDHTKISTTLDYGIGQINYKTAEAYGIDLNRLTSDRSYSIDRAAFVLSTFKKQFKSKEPNTWFCRYNVGTAEELNQNLKYKCQIYLDRVNAVIGAI